MDNWIIRRLSNQFAGITAALASVIFYEMRFIKYKTGPAESLQPVDMLAQNIIVDNDPAGEIS